MAVIVEVPEKSKGKKEYSKGKNIAAEERSEGFAAYLKELLSMKSGFFFFWVWNYWCRDSQNVWSP
jgi:hypothetical protein